MIGQQIFASFYSNFCHIFCFILLFAHSELFPNFLSKADVVSDDSPILPKSSSLLRHYFGAKLSSTLFTPCTYPTPTDPPSWQKCHVEADRVKKYNICDPETTIYFSKIKSLYKKLDNINEEQGDKCLCGQSKTGPSCWYKFAFAFLDELRQPIHALPTSIRAEELCGPNEYNVSHLHIKREKHLNWWHDHTKVEMYGRKFAEILSERWKIGTCHEDILILVVKKGPLSLMNSKSEPLKPVIFVHFGEFVRHDTDYLTDPDNRDLKAIDEAVKKVNHQLQGYGENSTLDKAIVTLITLLEDILILAEKNEQFFGQSAKDATAVKNHIPTWALGVFAGCALLLLIMALGLAWVRTRSRRVATRNKPAPEQARHWNAGFVGGEQKAEKKSQTKLMPMKIIGKRLTANTSGSSDSANSHLKG